MLWAVGMFVISTGLVSMHPSIHLVLLMVMGVISDLTLEVTSTVAITLTLGTHIEAM